MSAREVLAALFAKADAEGEDYFEFAYGDQLFGWRVNELGEWVCVGSSERPDRGHGAARPV